MRVHRVLSRSAIGLRRSDKEHILASAVMYYPGDCQHLQIKEMKMERTYCIRKLDSACMLELGVS